MNEKQLFASMRLRAAGIDPTRIPVERLEDAVQLADVSAEAADLRQLRNDVFTTLNTWRLVKYLVDGGAIEPVRYLILDVLMAPPGKFVCDQHKQSRVIEREDAKRIVKLWHDLLADEGPADPKVAAGAIRFLKKLLRYAGWPGSMDLPMPKKDATKAARYVVAFTNGMSRDRLDKLISPRARDKSRGKKLK